MKVVHRRPAHGDGVGDVLWLSDGTRPFVIVLLPQGRVEGRLVGPLNHLGIGLASREDVDERLLRARSEGLTTLGPLDSGPPVGYWGTIDDPDGNALEVAFGQEVGLTVAEHDL